MHEKEPLLGEPKIFWLGIVKERNFIMDYPDMQSLLEKCSVKIFFGWIS